MQSMRSVKSFHDRGEIALSQENYREAISCFNKAIEENYQYALSFEKRGDARRALAGEYAYQMRSKDASDMHELAIKDYLEAAKWDHDRKRPYYLAKCGDVHLAEHRGSNTAHFDLAIQYYTDAIKAADAKSNPDQENYYSKRGKAYHLKGDQERALADYSKAIEKAKDKDKAHHYSVLGLYYQDIKKYREAIQNLEEVVKIYPWAVTHETLGNLYHSAMNFDEAVKHYKLALEHQDKKSNNYLSISLNISKKLGKIYSYIRNDVEAHKCYTTVVQLDPDFKHLLDKGDEYSNKHYATALNYYNQAIEIAPHASAYKKRGDLHYCQNKFKDAIIDYSLAIDRYTPEYNKDNHIIAQELSFAYYKRANSYYQQRKYKQTIADCTQAIAYEIHYASLFDLRGNAYSALGEYENAIADYSTAISYNQKYASLYLKRGDAYRALKRADQAIADYSAGIENSSPPDASLHFKRGDYYFENEDYDKAAYDYIIAWWIKNNPRPVNINALKTDEIFLAIKALPDEDKHKQIVLLNQCLSENTLLGKHFRETKSKTKLSDIEAYLKKLDPSDVTVVEEKAIENHALEDYKHSVKSFFDQIEKDPSVTTEEKANSLLTLKNTYEKMQGYVNKSNDRQLQREYYLNVITLNTKIISLGRDDLTFSAYSDRGMAYEMLARYTPDHEKDKITLYRGNAIKDFTDSIEQLQKNHENGLANEDQRKTIAVLCIQRAMVNSRLDRKGYHVIADCLKYIANHDSLDGAHIGVANDILVQNLASTYLYYSRKMGNGRDEFLKEIKNNKNLSVEEQEQVLAYLINLGSQHTKDKNKLIKFDPISVFFENHPGTFKALVALSQSMVLQKQKQKNNEVIVAQEAKIISEEIGPSPWPLPSDEGLLDQLKEMLEKGGNAFNQSAFRENAQGFKDAQEYHRQVVILLRDIEENQHITRPSKAMAFFLCGTAFEKIEGTIKNYSALRWKYCERMVLFYNQAFSLGFADADDLVQAYFSRGKAYSIRASHDTIFHESGHSILTTSRTPKGKRDDLEDALQDFTKALEILKSKPPNENITKKIAIISAHRVSIYSRLDRMCTQVITDCLIYIGTCPYGDHYSATAQALVDNLKSLYNEMKINNEGRARFIAEIKKLPLDQQKQILSRFIGSVTNAYLDPVGNFLKSHTGTYEMLIMMRNEIEKEELREEGPIVLGVLRKTVSTSDKNKLVVTSITSAQENTQPEYDVRTWLNRAEKATDPIEASDCYKIAGGLLLDKKDMSLRDMKAWACLKCATGLTDLWVKWKMAPSREEYYTVIEYINQASGSKMRPYYGLSDGQVIDALLTRGKAHYMLSKHSKMTPLEQQGAAENAIKDFESALQLLQMKKPKDILSEEAMKVSEKISEIYCARAKAYKNNDKAAVIDCLRSIAAAQESQQPDENEGNTYILSCRLSSLLYEMPPLGRKKHFYDIIQHQQFTNDEKQRILTCFLNSLTSSSQSSLGRFFKHLGITSEELNEKIKIQPEPVKEKIKIPGPEKEKIKIQPEPEKHLNIKLSIFSPTTQPSNTEIELSSCLSEDDSGARFTEDDSSEGQILNIQNEVEITGQPEQQSIAVRNDDDETLTITTSSAEKDNNLNFIGSLKNIGTFASKATFKDRKPKNETETHVSAVQEQFTSPVVDKESKSKPRPWWFQMTRTLEVNQISGYSELKNGVDL